MIQKMDGLLVSIQSLAKWNVLPHVKVVRRNVLTRKNPKKGVKVNLKTKKVKGAITKDVIKKGLLTYFGGNEAQVEGAYNAIMDAAPVKEKSGVSVSGLKDL